MSEHAAGGEAEVQRLAAAMAAERTTAAERMALTAVIVMAGAMLGLGRVGGGSGWLLGLRWHGRWCAEGTAGCRVAPTSATHQVSGPSFRAVLSCPTRPSYVLRESSPSAFQRYPGRPLAPMR